MHSLVHFLASLGAGFIGIGLVLTPLLEGPLNDWDPFAEIRFILAKKAAERIPQRSAVEDLLLEIEASRKFGYGWSGASDQASERELAAL